MIAQTAFGRLSGIEIPSRMGLTMLSHPKAQCRWCGGNLHPMPSGAILCSLCDFPGKPDGR